MTPTSSLLRWDAGSYGFIKSWYVSDDVITADKANNLYNAVHLVLLFWMPLGKAPS